MTEICATRYVLRPIKLAVFSLLASGFLLQPQTLQAESAIIKTSAPAAAVKASGLTGHYARLQESLLAKGRLRQDKRPADAQLAPDVLTHNFQEIALRHEYSGGSKPLLRWETPIRYSVAFGQSVSDERRIRDRADIGGYFSKLSRLSGRTIMPVSRHANFHVLVVGDGERRSIGQFLKTNVDGISNAAVNSILRMQPNHVCMVVTVPHSDKSKGIRSAVAIVRAELTGKMRQSCIQEELAQGMGLPNDCRTARPSIFNDNEEFGVLTRHDEALMTMLYNPALRSGMPRKDVMPIVERLSRRAMK